LARQDEISSTERLLDLIRGKSAKDSDSTVFPPTYSPAVGVKPSFLQALAFKKKITIGVDIGRKGLRLVKIGQTGDKKPELLDYSYIPFDPSISRNTPHFLRLFKSALATFCGASEKFEIWSAISSASVETRYLRIPKVPKKQISNVVYWTYKKDVAFSEQSEVFDYDVLGDILEDGVPKIEIMAYSAPKQEIEELKNIFTKSGYSLSGISIIPFTLQNLFRTQWVKDGKNVCTLFVGSDWSRIAIFSNGNLMLSRDIKAGIKSMIEAFREEIDKKQPEQSPLPVQSDEADVFESFDEKPDHSTDKAQKLLFDFIDNNSSETGAGELSAIDSERLFGMILPALDRVVRQIERTIRHYYLQARDASVGKIFISGKISINRRIIDYISDQLGLPAESIDPFASGALLSAGVSVPESESEREAFIPAVGMALSNNAHTPNFIFTYKEKERLALNLRIKRLVFGSSLLVMAICIGFSFWQSWMLDQKKSSIAKLERQLEQYSPVVDQNLIVSMVTKAQNNIDTAEAFVKKYHAMGVISELTQITPPDIRLSNIAAEMGWPKGYLPSEKTSLGQQKKIVIEGVVFGNRLTFESTLAGYLIKLKSSPMFSQPVIKEKSYVFFENQEVLRFIAQLEFT